MKWEEWGPGWEALEAPMFVTQNSKDMKEKQPEQHPDQGTPGFLGAVDSPSSSLVGILYYKELSLETVSTVRLETFPSLNCQAPVGARHLLLQTVRGSRVCRHLPSD